MVPHVHLRSATRKLVAAVFVIFITLAVTNSLWAIALAYDCTGQSAEEPLPGMEM